jgi:hypothetical protein
MVDALDVGQSTVSHHCRLLRRQVVGPEGLLHLQFRASLAGEEALQRVLAGNPEARTRKSIPPPLILSLSKDAHPASEG